MGQKQACFLSAGFAVFILLVGCGHHSDPEVATAALLSRGLSGDLSSLDPAAAADTFSIQVLQDLYKGLTAESPTGSATPTVRPARTLDVPGTQDTFHPRPRAR